MLYYQAVALLVVGVAYLNSQAVVSPILRRRQRSISVFLRVTPEIKNQSFINRHELHGRTMILCKYFSKLSVYSRTPHARDPPTAGR